VTAAGTLHLDAVTVPEGALEATLAAAGVGVVAIIEGPGPILGALAVIVALLLVDLLLFARGREPGFREAATWSVGWLILSLLIALPIAALDSGDAAVNYVTVYLIERTLSLDNLFVFLLIFGYFQIPAEARPKLLFWGIVIALVLRGVAIVAGVELLESFHALIYVLGAMLLLLAWRMLRGGHDDADPGQSVVVRAVRRIAPGASAGLLALVSMGFADLAFAIDSIPAAFAITTDSFVIWTANAFALMGMRALFVLVEGLIARFRYMDETLAVVLALVGAKLLLSDVVHVSAAGSLGIVAACFAVGIVASLRADRKATPSGSSSGAA
jgi:tellurite resistance protein TerC